MKVLAQLSNYFPGMAPEVQPYPRMTDLVNDYDTIIYSTHSPG